MSKIDDYLKDADPSKREMLEHIRKIIKEIVPEVEETISYGVPCFNYKNKYLIYFAAYKNHMSLYPASDGMIKELGEDVEKFRSSKGTLQFTEDNPIPDALVKKIIRYRLKSITESDHPK